MTVLPWLPWVVVAACAVPVALGLVALLFRQPLHVEAFIGAVAKLILAGDEQRAGKLVEAASHVLVGKVAAALLAADVPLLDPDRTPQGYRDHGEERSFQDRLREAVAPAVQDARRRVVRAGLLTLLGTIPLPALWLLGVRWSSEPGRQPLYVACVLLALSVGGLVKARSNWRAIARVVEGLAPVLQERLEMHPRGGRR